MGGIQAISCCGPARIAGALNSKISNAQKINSQMGLASDVFEKQNDVSFGGGKWVPENLSRRVIQSYSGLSFSVNGKIQNPQRNNPLRIGLTASRPKHPAAQGKTKHGHYNYQKVGK